MGVHNALFLFNGYQIETTNDNRALNSVSESIIKKIFEQWPLKRGSVRAQYYPWNVYSNSSDCIRFFTAFVLKCFFVLCDQDESKGILLLRKIFENRHFGIYFWDLIASNFDEIVLSKKNFKSNVPIILCLSDTVLQMRSQSNHQLALFEKFLEHLIRHGNGLIVFSVQKLCSESPIIFTSPLYSSEMKMQQGASDRRVYKREAHTQATSNDAASSFPMSIYSTEHFKNLSKNQSSQISIEEAFEPIIFGEQNNTDQVRQKFSTGSFDRLLELLTMGQDFIFSIESAFKEKSFLT